MISVKNEMKVIENGLVPVYSNRNRQVVNARELHEFLGVGKDFSTWLKDRIEKYAFLVGEDYEVFFPNSGENLELTSGRGRPAKNYLLTLDMAKELAMVENNEKGRQARKYFIACEKRLKELSNKYAPQIPTSFAEALRLAANLQEEKEALEAKIEEDKPKVEFTKAVESSENSILIRELATFIQQAGMDMGQNRLFKILRDEGYLIKSGTSRNKPTQRAKDMGLFEVKERVVEKANGTSITTSTTMVTGKGQVYFIMKFQEQLRNPKSKNTNIVSFPA